MVLVAGTVEALKPAAPVPGVSRIGWYEPFQRLRPLYRSAFASDRELRFERDDRTTKLAGEKLVGLCTNRHGAAFGERASARKRAILALVEKKWSPRQRPSP